MLQAALLALKPLERVTVVWRYVSGFKVAELAPVAGEAKRDLSRYLIDHLPVAYGLYLGLVIENSISP